MVTFAAGDAHAQDGGLVSPGNAVVTGFSGFLASEAPENADPFDYLSINLEGPAAQIIDLSALGPQGELSDAPKTSTIQALQVGQVFGVALDNAPQPSIYLAATSAYGISIYLPDGSDSVQRIRAGAPGAQFIPGQFGPPEWSGGPGSIWRVDGTTGEVLLFANIDSASYGAAALGGLAFDPVSQQLFAVDRATGIIHRFGLDGTEQGTYDHGIEGRPAGGLAPLPLPPTAPVDINSASFDTEDPGTWGYAPPARRVFALGVRNSRLYYSIAQGPQIWSVGIGANGSLAANPRFELEAPALVDGAEITSIAFDGNGRMYLAERGPTVGDYEMTSLAVAGQARVLRFVPKPAGDGTPGLWRLEPDQYAIGLPEPYNNANGGVALGYGHQQSGAINFGVCRGTLWSTGERLLDPGDPSLPPDSYPAIDGLQGNAPSLIEPQNEPPYAAWFIDYDDAPGSPAYVGYMGAVAIYSPCAAQGTYVPPPPVVTCPPGTSYYGGECIVTVTCPPGTTYKNGACIYPSCPYGYVLYQGQCIPPPLSCPPGSAYYNGKCVPLECPPGMKRMPNGQCICPVNNIWYNGRCIPPNQCPKGMVQYPNGVCWCPPGTHFQNGKCVPNFCPKGYIPFNNKCVPAFCPPGYFKGPGGLCIPEKFICKLGEIIFNGKCVIKKCPPYQELGPNGKCYPVFGPCKQGEIVINGKCVPKKCPPFQELGQNGKCKPIVIIDCQKGYKLVNGKCVQTEKCKANEVLVNGKCVKLGIVPKPLQCKKNEVVKNGKCVAADIKPIECKPNQKFVNGKCVPIVCKANQKLVAGECVNLGIVPKPLQCKDNQVIKNGKCVAAEVEIQPIECKQNQRLVKGKCMPIVCRANQKLVAGECVNLGIVPKPLQCKDNQVVKNGKCVAAEVEIKPIVCKGNQKLVAGECVAQPVTIQPACEDNQRLVKGKCVSIEVQKCKNNQKLVNGKCVAIEVEKACKNNEKLVGGKCVAAAAPAKLEPGCRPNQELLSGQCVRKCGDGEVRNKNGKCVARKGKAPAGAQPETQLETQQ